MTPLETELSQLIVTRLELDLDPAAIDPAAPLFGEGLGLDSIGALEISLIISDQYGVKLSTENENVNEIFSSLRSLCAYVETHRA
ncbi:MAG: acyl carrier protein [Nitrospinae bacterium]|nr:acyl carrier protein [Nitrospinota bacterium]